MHILLLTRPSSKDRDQAKEGQNRGNDHKKAAPKVDILERFLLERRPHVGRDAGRIEEDVEFGRQQQRHEHHAAGVPLRQVVAQVSAVFHRPRQVTAPNGKMVNGDHVFAQLQQTQDRRPSLCVVIPALVDAAGPLLERQGSDDVFSSLHFEFRCLLLDTVRPPHTPLLPFRQCLTSHQ